MGLCSNVGYMKSAFLIIVLVLYAGVAVAQGYMDGARSADIVIIGETHDNPDHHRLQATLVSDLRPAAVVFEMISPDQAATITPALIADEAALSVALEWESSGWPAFNMYYPVFAAAEDAVIYGAAVLPDDIRKAMRQGTTQVFRGFAPRFDLHQPLPAEQQAARLALQDDAHCNAIPAEMLPAMVEVQRLRDAELASAALLALDNHGAPIVVITGNGHARNDWGVPAMFKLVRPALKVISIGQGEDGVPPEGGFDYIVDAPAPNRSDPCDVFRQ